VVIDVKVGPPLYEKGLAKDILSVVSLLFACPSPVFYFILFMFSNFHSTYVLIMH
jgi:hypothetical protein